MKKILTALLICFSLFPIHSVLATSADPTAIPILSRGHIQDLGDYPADGSWVESPNRIGTVGQSKRIEGFELKPDASLPADIELRYNVHVQNIGWLYDENDPTSWAKNGEYAGTRGDSLRIEAIKIVLLDASGNKASGYHIHYQGHVQNIGDLPTDSEQWFVDGEQLGTVGSSLRLEALKLEIIKDAEAGGDLSTYTTLIKQIESLNESDYSKTSWVNLQTVLKNHVVTNKNTTEEVAGAVKAIEAAMQKLEKLSTTTAYDKSGTYGPTSGTETINQDVIITAAGVTLQNLTIKGNLIIDEAVGDGDVTLNNVTVSGELRVRGGGKNSIHINGGAYSKILVERAPDGGVRIVATGLDGVPVVLSENAAGETLILEGSFDSVTVQAPDVVIKTQGQTRIKSLDVAEDAKNTALDLGSTTTVTNLVLSSPTKVTGTGTVSKAEIASDNVSFEKAPQDYTIEPGVVVPPVIPKPETPPQPGGGGYIPPSKISLSVTIAPTVTLSKTYDGNTATDVTAKAMDGAAITGIAAGDNVSVLATATYDDKNVRTDKTITITYRLSGTNADKYNPPAATTVKGEIVKKNLRSPATPSVSKEFDGTTTLTTVITEDLGQVNADTLTITRTATYQNSAGNATDAKEVGTSKTVQCSYHLSGTDASNYTAPADQSGTGTITKRTLSVSAASLNINKTKTYDGTADVYNSTGNIITSGNNSINVATGVAGDANINVTATVAYNDQNAGDKTITVSYTIGGTNANSRYQVTPTETISNASITKRQLTIPANQVPTPVAKAYDGTADVFTMTNNAGRIYDTPVTPDNLASADAGKVAVAATAAYDAGKDVGIGKKITIHYTLSGDAASNYLAPPDDQSKSADITPLTLKPGTIDANTKTKEYDGTSTAGLGIGVGLENQLFNSVFSEELTQGVLGFDRSSKYYTDSNCQTETSKPNEAGTALYIKYTISLTGTSAGNYVFAGGNPTFTASTNGGSITAKRLSVTADAMGLQTIKTYDGNSSTNVSGTTFTNGNGLTGIVGIDDVSATASSQYAGATAGDHTITTSFTLSGDDADNYCIDPLTSGGKINPVQLEVKTESVPTVATTKKYDGTTIVKDASDQPVTNRPVTLTDVLTGDSANVTVTATASYDNKNVGINKTITIHYSLSGDAAKNYLAPVTDESKTAAITPRTLGYTNVDLDMIKKYQDGDSSVTVNDADFAPNGAGYDAIVAINNTWDDITLSSCSADYYNDDLTEKTSAIGLHKIMLTGTLTGADAGNYVMADYIYSESGNIKLGQIVNANAVISTPYNSTSWNGVGILTAPAANFKLFYAKQNGATTTFYANDGDGKIYRSNNLTDWTVVTQVTIDSGKKLIGVDDSNCPLAIDSNYTTDTGGNKLYQIYSWSNGWSDYDDQSPEITNVIPINPTYYSDGSSSYLVYQGENNKVYKRVFSGSDSVEIGSYPGPSIPGSFKSSLLVYNVNTLMLYAY